MRSLTGIHLTSSQFVVGIEQGRVSGVMGSVFDAKGRFFSEFAPVTADIPDIEALVGR
jgi:hypothetical protein